MSAHSSARCAAMLSDRTSFRAAAALQVLEGARGVVREATVVYWVSPGLADPGEALASGLRGRVRIWKELAAMAG